MKDMRWQAYTLPTMEMQVATMPVSLDDLAARCQLEIGSFDGDGLGPVRSIGFQTTAGHVYQISEWAMWPIEQPKSLLTVRIDATVLAELGAEPLVAELIEELGVSRSDFTQIADAAAQEAAAKIAAEIKAMILRSKLPKPQHDGEISFDLVMEDDMSFVEGTYRLRQGEWRVFIFSRYEGKQVLSSSQRCESGVEGWRIKTPQEMKLNRESVMKILGDLLYVEQWFEVRGPRAGFDDLAIDPTAT
jgi:hypothetical protein